MKTSEANRTMTIALKGTPEGRVVSIDALRGFDMFFITGGGAFIEKTLLALGTF